MIKYYIAIAIITLLVIGVIIFGFIKGGTPWQARKERFDQTRVANIQTLENSIWNYYDLNHQLPQTLAQLASDKYFSSSRSPIKDPETNADYEYKVTGPLSYQLCANFDDATPKNTDLRTPYYTISQPQFQHPAGHYCFDLEVQPITKVPAVSNLSNMAVPSPWTDQVPSEGEHWDKVAEAQPDEDKTYIQAVADGLWDQYSHQPLNLPDGSTISSVKVWVRAKYVVSSFNNVVAPALNVDGSLVWSDNTITGSYENYAGEWLVNPKTQKPWTVADINSAKIAVRKSYAGAKVNVTSVWMEIKYSEKPITSPKLLILRPAGQAT